MNPIKEKRLAQGLTQQYLANAIGVAPSTEAEIKMENIEKSRAADLARMNEPEKKGVALTAEEQAEYYRLQDALVGYNSEMLDAADAIKTYTKAVEKDNEALAEAETHPGQRLLRTV